MILADYPALLNSPNHPMNKSLREPWGGHKQGYLDRYECMRAGIRYDTQNPVNRLLWFREAPRRKGS